LSSVVGDQVRGVETEGLRVFVEHLFSGKPLCHNNELEGVTWHDDFRPPNLQDLAADFDLLDCVCFVPVIDFRVGLGFVIRPMVPGGDIDVMLLFEGQCDRQNSIVRETIITH